MVLTKNALVLAQGYHDIFAQNFMRYVNGKRRKCVRRIPNDWKKRWSVVLQRRIDLTDFNTVRRQILKFAQDFAEKKSDRFVRGPQCLPWPKPERKDTAVHLAESPNEPSAMTASGSPQPYSQNKPKLLRHLR